MPYSTREHAPDPANPSQRPQAGHVQGPEPRGCLFALSQPPLILFLTVIGGLLLVTGVYDQFLL